MKGFNFKDELKSFYNFIIYKYLKEMIKKAKR